MRILGGIDLHVHAGPEARPRKLTATELAFAARAAGMGGFVLKRHYASTADEAAALQAAFPELVIRGGITLNGAVGGVTPAAVEPALRAGAAIVWMPTADAAHDRAFRGQPGTGLTVVDERGRLTSPAAEVVRLVAQSGAVLALGHLGPREMTAVVAHGRSVGVRCFLVSHPEIDVLDLSVPFQRELMGPDVLFERCYVRRNQTVDWDGLARRIRDVGVDCAALATDLGQPEWPAPPDGFAEMLDRLAARGFSDAELTRMAVTNPQRVLRCA